ncbi:trifunctional serine/threonine-protein kinase/ATP-binding protein/sensor histidine kinase [Tardiphaga sp. 862_B3_N4_1]|uniref:trifunctional serine/threonine-protein kinase/ATP-binding protein/sensor histidine kinase n=1 Tax=Tardiphaga sp. 862_B3_N4_1 TaxID=3240764 RepID=UPI003F232452
MTQEFDQELDSMAGGTTAQLLSTELRFEPIRAGEASTLYRAHSPFGRSMLAIVARSDAPFIRAANRLKKEYRISNELEPDWALRPIAYVLYQDRPTLLLEDPGGEPLDQVLLRMRRPLTDWSHPLSLACSITAAVRKMHEHGVTHRDINPQNIFVDEAGGVRLAGFGLAAGRSFDNVDSAAGDVIAGTFAYMAPEQTGRVNWPVDSRSDLYGLGITLYELFTGTLPFTAKDATEWAHCHIAKKPPLPAARSPGIPAAINRIILKFLVKDPLERYQTARGAESDLTRCLLDWRENSYINDFEPGGNDISDRLSISKTLYGRDRALGLLTAAADRVITTGSSELILVSGSAGIGKSSLVSGLHRSLKGRGLLFATGKCDQYKRDIPNATLAQAFRGLVLQLLTKTDEDLALWRSELVSVLGANAQLMIGLVPELAVVLGEQPNAPPVDLRAAQARFHLVFRALLRVFAKPEHPLILFIDDLQWLDSATLDFLNRLFTSSELPHILVIGAYRDDEIGDNHPLLQALETVRPFQGAVTNVRLGPLTTRDLTILLSDALGASTDDVSSLADLVNEKAAGNPFFSIQFLREIASEGFLRFDPHQARWTWNLFSLRDKEMTDNVAHLIAARIGRLSSQAREALSYLSLLGNAADAHTISLVRGSNPDDICAALQSAADAGLVQSAEGVFSFVHDHVQEAAYALISDNDRIACHASVGWLLLSRHSSSELEKNIFEIVAQFERGFAAIEAGPRSEQVARLYFIAAMRAKKASAFSSASNYFSRGRQLLNAGGGDPLSDFLFQLDLNHAECEIATGEWTLAETRLSLLSLRAISLSDRAGTACLAMLMHFTRGQSERAVRVGLDFLSKATMSWPAQPTSADVDLEYATMHRDLGGRSSDALLALPEMTDPTILATMAVLTELFPAAYAVDRHLMELVLLRMVNLSLQFGHCASSAVAYSAINMATGIRFADYKTAHTLGAVALKLVDRHDADRYKARVYCCLAAFTVPWNAHIASANALTVHASQIGAAMGDFAFAAYNSRNRITHLLMSGTLLTQVQQEAEQAISIAKSVELGLPVNRFFGQLRLVAALRATGPSREDNDWAVKDLEGPPGRAMMACYHWVFRLQEYYFTEDYNAALSASSRLDDVIWAMRSSAEEAEYIFFSGLTKASAIDRSYPRDRDELFDCLSAHCDRLTTWACINPSTFESREALLRAELARLQGRERDAQNLYEQAIRLSRLNGFIQVEALAHELAGRFYKSLNLVSVSDIFIRNAYDCYDRWGCVVKTRLLERRHPDIRRGASMTSVEVPLAHIDVQVVGRASKTLSSEMDLENLIEKLMRLALEHAGAERGLLLLLDGNKLKIEAEAVTEQGSVKVQVSKRELTPVDLSYAAVQYVIRTQAPIVLDGGAGPDLVEIDDYLESWRPRSILCLPIIKTVDVIGVLYLENSMTTRAFTTDRASVLDFLASQAAIWLDNARLYSDLQRSEAWLREAQHLSLSGSFYWHVPTDALEFSEEMYRICQIAPGQSVTIRLLESRVYPGDLLDFHKMIEDARATGADLNSRFRLLLPDLSEKHVHLVAHSGRAKDGGLQYVGAIQDVSRQHLSQQALAKARSELAHVSRATTLGALTASIAHEVNQPLLGIVTNATTCLRMLAASPPNIEGARKTAERSVRDGHRAADMIRRLRSLFAGSGTVREPIDVNSVVREVISLVMTELQSSLVVLDIRLAANIPVILADRVQIQQVILNLLLNASDAMRYITGRPRKLSVVTRLNEGISISIEVADSGTGFDPQTGDRMFDAFYTTKVDGMGMGLSVSRSIVESHGGRIWASLNNDGPGASLFISLPTRTFGTATVSDLSASLQYDSVPYLNVEIQ